MTVVNSRYRDTIRTLSHERGYEDRWHPSRSLSGIQQDEGTQSAYNYIDVTFNSALILRISLRGCCITFQFLCLKIPHMSVSYIASDPHAKCTGMNKVMWTPDKYTIYFVRKRLVHRLSLTDFILIIIESYNV